MESGTATLIKSEFSPASDPETDISMETEQISSTVAEAPHYVATTARTSFKTSSSAGKLSWMRNEVEERSQNLSNSWNELYTLLSEYKSQLYSQETLSEKYQNVSDVSVLKTDLIEKENELMERDSTISSLHEEIKNLNRQSEQDQMDLAVKDNLLKKYQHDLLEKDSALMTSQTKLTRLENRLKALEASAEDSLPSRKMMKPSVVRVGAGRGPGGRPVSGAVNTAISRTSVKSPLTPQKRRSALGHNQARGRHLTTAARPRHQTSPAVVLVGSHDTTESPASRDLNDRNYSNLWLKPVKTESTSLSDLPGTSLEDLQEDQQVSETVSSGPPAATNTKAVGAVLCAAGHTVQIDALRRGPLVLRETPSSQIHQIFTTLENLGLGSVLRKGIFQKTSPDQVRPELLTAFGCDIQRYRASYGKPITRHAKNKLTKEPR